MAGLRAFLSRVRSLLRRRRLDATLDEELRAHVEMLTDDYVSAGMTPDEARRQARLRLGGIEQTKEVVRDQRGFPFVDQLAQDLRYAVRTLGKTPAFTVFAVLTLALGIGATTAMFTVVNAVLLRPFPLDRPEQIVRLYEDRRVEGRTERGGPSPDNFVDWRARARAFDGIAVFRWPTYNLVGHDQTDLVQAMAVSADFFRVMRVQPVLGRAFAPDESPGPKEIRKGWVVLKTPPRAVILSYDLWQRAVGGTPDVLGRTVRLGTDDMAIVGVMPRDFTVPAVMKPEHVQQGPDCWVPEAMVGHEGRRVSWGLSGIARVRDDVSLEHAQAEMNGIASQLEREYPDDNRDKTIRLVPLREAVVGDVRPQLRVFAAAVAFVLLIACANVANLLLVRATGRRRELATRSALGASRWRLVRQLLTETMLLSAVACAVGLLFAHWSMAALIAVAPPRLPRLNEVALDGVALFFSVIVSLATGVVCGLVPALQSSRTDINDALKDEGPTTMGRRRRWLSNALIVAETALALVLLIGAGLMTRTFVTLHGVDPGFRSDHVLTVGFNQSLRNFNMAAGRRFYRELIGRVQALPGVDAAAVGSVPIARDTGSAFWVEGRPDKLDCAFSPVTDQFFRVFGIRLMEGRTFAAIDTTDATPVAVLSRSLARQLWPNASAIGKRIAFSDPATERTVAWASIVGVVDDTRNDGLEKTPRPQAYVPLWQNRMIDPNNMVVRTAGNPRDLLPAIRTVVREIDKDRALARVATLDDRIAELVAPRRFNLFVIGVFSMLAFVLAIVGVYAVVSHTVAIRTREIGTRMVLGADRVTIFRLVARQSLSLILLGEVMGLMTALGVNRLMKMMVFGVTTTDASTYATTACVFAAIALLASYVPARRATRIDPMAALRCE